MFIAYAIIAILLSVSLVVSATGKLIKMPQVVEMIVGLGVPLSLLPVLALLEIAGAVGLIAGLWVQALGIAAGTGVVLYFIGAVTTHVRAHNREFGPAIFLGLVAAVATILRILAHK